MSATVTRDNLVSTFLGEWSETPVFVQNVQGKPNGSAYVLIQTAISFSEQPCLGRDSGSTWERDIGDCVLIVHVPMNYSGDGLALAERAKNVLSQRRIGETITDVGYIIGSGESPEDKRYYAYSIRIPYRTDNLKS